MTQNLDLAAAKTRLMLALDLDSREKAEEWVHKMKLHVGYFKVGLQLFTVAGGELVRSIRARGGRVFLDVKYHDIPNTVAKACEAACSLGVDFINVHGLGGKTMIKAAALALKESSERMRQPRPKLLAVTILTSHDLRSLRNDIGLRGSIEKEVLRLAKLAQAAGADGVVASPKEIKAIRKACGPKFVIVTPGIRGSADKKDDQKRTMTAGDAVAAGADYVVVGRPLTQASDPGEAARALVIEIAKGLNRSVQAAKSSKDKKGKKR